MNNNSNISKHPTPQTQSARQTPQTGSVIPQSSSVTPQTSSVTPQTGSDRPQSRMVSSETQTSSVSHQTQTGAELTEAAEHAVDPSLKLKEHAVVIQRTPITRGNLRRLLNNQKPKDMYLDDEIINFYFARLMDRAERHPTLPKIHCYLTQFFESTKRENWASKVTVFDKDIVLIPILIKAIDHWVLVAFFPLIKTAIYYDSLHKDGTSIRKQVLQFFKTRFPNETGSASDDSEWKSVDEPHVPKQENGFDCGVFVCQMAERLSRRSEFDFDQSQMPAIRIQMIEQIVAGEIPLPPSEQVTAAPPRPSNFDKPPSKQITCLETLLRDLRAKFATQEIELKELKSKAENQHRMKPFKQFKSKQMRKFNAFKPS